LPEREAQQVIEALAEDLGSHVRSRVRPIERGLWELTLSFAREPFGDPGDEVPTDLMLIADFDHTIVENPLLRMAKNGSVLIASDLEAETSSAVLPTSWRDAIGELGLGLFRVGRGGAEGDPLEALVRAAVALVREQHDELERVAWDELTDGDRIAGDTALPLAVRRFGQAGETYDNVARFWGELAEPRTHETARAAVPDPYLASGSVPACTSTFHDATSGRETFPTIDAARCTGCGKCWTECPDSAIGPVALGTAALLDAAADMAEAAGEAAAKLRRAHKQLAAKIDGSLARSEEGELGGQAVREAFDWLVEKMGVVADERTEMAQAFEATLEHLEAMPLSVTAPFFREPHAEQKGSGQLLMLAINPRACQGCGVCSAVCSDGAVRRDPQAPPAVQRMRELWRVWEELPDTAGTTISRVAKHPEVGPLAAVLLSRHCMLSVTGGDGAEPGSGERIATRQVAAVVEYRMQRRVLSHVEDLAALEARLRKAIRTGLSEAVAVENLDQLDDALRRLRSEHAAGTELLDHLNELGERTDVDVPRVQRLVALARGVERTRRSLTEGAHGVGRARYGVVLANGVASDWAGLFPRNPFSVPMTVDLGADGADVAAGLSESLLSERVETSRLIRRSELWLDDPSDLRARDRELDALTPGELTADELELCPPILVLAGGDALTRPAQAGLSRLLTSGLPVKVVLFDEHDLLSREAEPAMLALAHRRAFVLSTSFSHPRHLFEGVSEAMSFPGPALIHLPAPSPRRHGFAADATVERAASAVECRVHPLLRYDPSAEGFFGLRISLEGNPSVVDTWVVDGDGGARTPLHWAEGERRFKDSTLLSDARGSAQPTVPGPNGRGLALGEILDRAAANRGEIWATLQELAGVTTPFTETVRSRAEDEVRQERESELAALKAEYEAELQARDDEQLTAQADRLRRRLLQLAGYGEGKAS
jgi:pyruvate-ferredoxin/flavodoxin oxidoreductase